MSQLNNVNLEEAMTFATSIQKDSSKAKKTQIIEGEWLLDDAGPQFRAAIKYEEGQTNFEMDSPTFMGGNGRFPGPIHYCFFGLASCYTATFATMAAMLGVRLTKLSTRVEADINFSRVFGINELPIMEEVRVKLTVLSDAPEEKLREVEQLAIQRCPVVFTLRNPIKLTPSLEIRTE